MVNTRYLKGRLFLNDLGRYAIDQYHYFTSGSGFEIYIFGKWHFITIECDFYGKYYAVGFPGLNLTGFLARVKVG